MRRDAIFRISSMTKPVAAAATLSTVEDGVLDLDEPLDRLLPELADPDTVFSVPRPTPCRCSSPPWRAILDRVANRIRYNSSVDMYVILVT
jgi:hypothetical protein